MFSVQKLSPLLCLPCFSFVTLLLYDLFFQVFESIEEVEQIETEPKSEEAKQGTKMANGAVQNGATSPDSGHPSSRNFSITSVLSDGSLSTEDNPVPDTTPRSGSASQGIQGPIKPAGAKAEVLPEGSPEWNLRDQKEEKEEAETAAQAMTTPPSLENKMEEESKTQDSVEESGAIQAKEISDQQTNHPPEVLLAKREDKISAAQVEKSLIFSVHSGRVSPSQTNFPPQRDSDESPSAIEMEEIPKANVSMVPWRKGRCEASPLSDNTHGLLREGEQQGKASPEGTESLLSDVPEMENLYPNFDSGPEVAKNDDKSETTSEIAGTPLTVRTCVLLAFTGIIRHLCPVIVPSFFQQELLDLYTLNLHRIEKDVQRCDRNYWYFTAANLEKLRNIMCRYI